MTQAKLANDSWEALLTSHSVLMKDFATEDTWRELSMREYDVLYALSKQREPMNVNELRQWVLLSQPALSRMVDRLVERGFITREVNPADRRSLQLSLSEAGRECQRRAGRKHARRVTRAMSVLEAEELEALRLICEKLAAANRKERRADE